MPITHPKNIFLGYFYIIFLVLLIINYNIIVLFYEL